MKKNDIKKYKKIIMEEKTIELKKDNSVNLFSSIGYDVTGYDIINHKDIKRVNNHGINILKVLIINFLEKNYPELFFKDIFDFSNYNFSEKEYFVKIFYNGEENVNFQHLKKLITGDKLNYIDDLGVKYSDFKILLNSRINKDYKYFNCI